MQAIGYLLSCSLIICACHTEQDNGHHPKDESTHYEHQPKFQALLDSSSLMGAILIYDTDSRVYYSNDFDWAAKGQLPASTFKIANSMIALELGIIEDDSTWIEWEGEQRSLAVWEQDLLFREAFHFSCVPCYREVARRIGVANMNAFVERLKYGDMSIDSSNIDLFWLTGDSRITPFEQIDFLKRFHDSELLISQRTERIMRRMMIMEEHSDLVLRGKTGWSTSDEKDNGWFVGYVQKEGKTYFFATNVEPLAAFDMRMFPEARKEVTVEALAHMKIISPMILRRLNQGG